MKYIWITQTKYGDIPNRKNIITLIRTNVIVIRVIKPIQGGPKKAHYTLVHIFAKY